MNPQDQPLTDLFARHLEISTRCGCTKVSVFSPEYLAELLGKGATLRIAAARLKCRTCRQRPRLIVKRDWATGEGRDRRPDPPPLPGWVLGLVEG